MRTYDGLFIGVEGYMIFVKVLVLYRKQSKEHVVEMRTHQLFLRK